MGIANICDDCRMGVKRSTWEFVGVCRSRGYGGMEVNLLEFLSRSDQRHRLFSLRCWGTVTVIIPSPNGCLGLWGLVWGLELGLV